MVSAFAARFRQILADQGVSQRELAKKIGGFRNDTLSRLARAGLASIPLDLAMRFSAWADEAGYNLRWLWMGVGPMRKGTTDPGEAISEQMNVVGQSRLILALAERAGVDLSDLVQQTNVTAYVPEWGVVVLPLDQAIARLEKKLGKPGVRLVEPGYATVAAEDVPTAPDWHEHYVPVLGRVAAGVGEETVEATEYPPAWAGEFLAYEGAPPTAIAVRVAGDSMRPDYADNDMVIVDPSRSAESGQVCCVVIDRDGVREARLKRFKTSGKWAILESLNPDYEPERIGMSRVLRVCTIVKHLPIMKEKP